MYGWKGDHYCRLCLRSITSWDHHVGSREHQCLRFFYTVITQDRRWKPLNIFQSSIFQKNIAHSHVSVDIADRQRRETLLSCIQFLMRNKVIDPSLGVHSECCFNGSTLMKEMAAPLLFTLMPGASVQEYSAFLQMSICSYNMETLWDLAQFPKIITSLGRKISFQEKGNRLQSLVGSIGPYVMSPIGSCPKGGEPGITHVVASFTARCIVMELLYIRSIEYVVKALNAWNREQPRGVELVNAKKALTLKSRFESAAFTKYVEEVVHMNMQQAAPSMPNVFLGSLA